MKHYIQFGKGFFVAVFFALAIMVWKSFPFGALYVSDMENWEIVSWNWAQPQRNTTINGNSLIINEITYENGIGAHAPAILKIPVPAGYTYFISDAGVSDEAPEDSPASIIFRVWGDGAVLCETPVIRANMPAYRMDVNVKGISELLLEATDAGDGANSDHAIWGAARFIHR